MATRPQSIPIDYENVELRRKQFRVSTISENQLNKPYERADDVLRMERSPVNDMPVNRRNVNSMISVKSNRLSNIRQDKIKANIGSKNGNMVLQLVLPNESQNSNHLDNNYFTTTSIDEILGEPGNKRNTSASAHDSYSTFSNEVFVNNGFTNDAGEYPQSFQMPSMPQSPISSTESDREKSTPPQEKNKYFRKHLSIILSSMYAVFVVTLGLVVYIGDVVIGRSPMAETFSLYLVITSLAFILYLIIDVRMFMNKRNHHQNLLQNSVTQEIEMKESPNGDYQFNITLPEAARIVKQLEHHYCLSKDRHSANFYLKIGAAGFCVGHLIHSGLLLGYQLLFLAQDGDAFHECASVITLILDIIYPIYSFFLLYFIFKYSNIIINRHMAIVRFGIMHCISSSLCFWAWTIIRETVESLSNHSYEEETEVKTARMSEVAFYKGLPLALPLTSYNKKGAELLTNYINSTTRQFIGLCNTDAGLKLIYQNYSPYLYPFTVEYSILVVGVLFVIWQNIGGCKTEMSVSQPRQCDTPEGSSDNLESNIVIHADCHSANKGLFGGIVIMVVTVVSIILFFIAITEKKESAILLNAWHSIIMVVLMTFISILLYRQITKLDINHEHTAILDDLLLFICIPAFFLNGIFSIIPAVISKSTYGITLVIAETLQVLVQTPLIIDGLRRSSNSRGLRREKPGRELLTFLIVCNVAMWILQTFEIKSHRLQDNRYDFYGQELWTIIGHMCLPLMMFYRFHSSVCLVDIWKYAYEPSSH